MIFAANTPSVAALRRETREIPIVFANLSDPVGSGLVASLARPGGNITGFAAFEYSLGGKWLEILRELAPNTKQVSVLSNPDTAPYAPLYVSSLEAAAPPFSMRLFAAPVRTPSEIEQAMVNESREPDSSLIVLPDSYTVSHRATVVALAARFRLPAVYAFQIQAVDGGLVSYGPETSDLYRRATSYIDRILRGANPADMPVQHPTKYEMVINLKTAKALGIEVPSFFQQRADEVIELGLPFAAVHMATIGTKRTSAPSQRVSLSRAMPCLWLGVDMKRREFITLLSGTAATWPLVARAQQSERTRRIGILHDYAAADPEGRLQIAAFREELRKLGWAEGRNVTIDVQSGAADVDLIRTYAKELVAKEPDVVLGVGGSIVAALQRATRTLPIVFVNVTDPVGGGLVASLARPGGNATGFTQFEFGISAKWLELLKEVAPGIMQVAVIRDPTARSGGGQLGAIQAVAPSFGVNVRPIDAGDAEAIQRDLAALSRETKTGLVVTSSRLARLHRELILSVAARHRVPAVYAFRVFIDDGGLMSYGPNSTTPYRRAASYVDRILKGEKPADLPVQAPTKYEFVINLKTAKALGLTVPTTLLARADEVIE